MRYRSTTSCRVTCTTSVRRASTRRIFAPFKLTCDVLVVGEALAHEEGEPVRVHVAAMTKRADSASLLGPLPADATDPFGQDAPMDQRLPWPPMPLQVGVVFEGRELDAILPGPVPEAALVYGEAFTEAVSLPLHIDGVQLDPVRATCVLTFRGSFQHAGSVHRDVLLVVDVLGRLAFATLDEVEGWARSPVEMDPSALADASLVIGEPAAIDAELTPIGEEASLAGIESEGALDSELAVASQPGPGSDRAEEEVIEVDAGELQMEEDEPPDSGDTGVFARPIVVDDPPEPEGDTDVGDDPLSMPVGTGTISMRTIGTLPPPPMTSATAAASLPRTRAPLLTLPLDDDAPAARPPTRPPGAPTAPALPFLRSHGAPAAPRRLRRREWATRRTASAR